LKFHVAIGNPSRPALCLALPRRRCYYPGSIPRIPLQGSGRDETGGSEGEEQEKLEEGRGGDGKGKVQLVDPPLSGRV